MHTHLLLPLVLLLACGGPPEAAPPSNGPTVLGASDFAVATIETLTVGPRVSGVLDAAQKSVIRSEAAGTVEEVLVEIGQAVKKGDVLARIEAVAVRESDASARSGVTAAQQDLLIAEREVVRVKRLVEVGALAARDLEQVESALIAARSRLQGAKAQSAGASQQLDGTVVRSPIAGVVSERAVNTGDVVAPGSPLFTVLDPSSLRLSGSVPASALGTLRVGAPVRVVVQGNPYQPFIGAVDRIAPSVDPTTRQIPVLITIPNQDGRLVAGLFAEGEIASDSVEGVVVPTDALLDDTSAVLVVRGGAVEQAAVDLGLRNNVSERVQIKTGVSAGEQVLLGPAREVAPGTKVSVGTPPAAPAAPAKEG